VEKLVEVGMVVLVVEVGIVVNISKTEDLKIPFN
jgi:hypothetical protein